MMSMAKEKYEEESKGKKKREKKKEEKGLMNSIEGAGLKAQGFLPENILPATPVTPATQWL
jgi:hypothetical protein